MGLFALDALTKVKAPEKRSYEQELNDTLDAQIGILPKVIAAEQKYQPQLAQAEVDTLKATQPQILELYKQTQPEFAKLDQEIASGQRAADINDVATLGPQAFEAFQKANPRLAALRDELAKQAQEGLAAGSSLTAEELRQVQQDTRGAQASRGMGFGPTDVFTEVLNAGTRGQQLKQGRQAFASNVANSEAATSLDPFMAILGRGSQSFNQAATASQQASATNPGPVVNPESQYASDINNQYWQGVLGAKTATAANRTAMISALLSSGSSLGGGAMCWVAREVFGESNPKWKLFRDWVMHRAPEWFRDLYLAHGEAFAAWLKDHPKHKPGIRQWMEERILSLRTLPYMDREGHFWNVTDIVPSFAPGFFQGLRQEDKAVVMMHKDDFLRTIPG